MGGCLLYEMTIKTRKNNLFLCKIHKKTGCFCFGGETEIRTLGSFESLVFKTSSLNHSDISPYFSILSQIKQDVNRKESIMVGVEGFEPAASWSQTMRATKLRQTPKYVVTIKYYNV